MWNIIPFFKQCCSKVVDVVWRVRTSTYASIQIISKMFNWVQIRTFWINISGFYTGISWPILQTQRVLQATTSIHVCTSKWYPWTTGTYFAKVSFLVQYICLNRWESHFASYCTNITGTSLQCEDLHRWLFDYFCSVNAR
jgi:hypothetical protein